MSLVFKAIPIRSWVASIQESVAARDVAMLVARLVLAWVFMYHGAGKLFNFKELGGISGTAAFFSEEGIPAAHVSAYLAGIVEFFGGALLALGLLTPLSAFALVIDMVVATLFVNLPNGMEPKAIGGGYVADGFEITLTLGALALVVAIFGAGRWSLDRLIGLAGPRAVGRPTAVPGQSPVEESAQ